MRIAKVPNSPESLEIALQPAERSLLLCSPPGRSGWDALVVLAGPPLCASCASGIHLLEVSGYEVRGSAGVVGMPYEVYEGFCPWARASVSFESVPAHMSWQRPGGVWSGLRGWPVLL